MDATYCYNMKNGSVWEFFLFRIPHIEDREEHRKNKVTAGEQKKEVRSKKNERKKKLCTPPPSMDI